jgi:hypothetical protein
MISASYGRKTKITLLKRIFNGERTMEQAREKIFSSLNISKNRLLDEISLLLAKQQISEFRMEIEYLEKNIKVLSMDSMMTFKSKQRHK